MAYHPFRNLGLKFLSIAIAGLLWLVVAGEPPTPEELSAFCRARLARYKVPVRFAFATSLPRSAGGKLLRRELAHSTGEDPR